MQQQLSAYMVGASKQHAERPGAFHVLLARNIDTPATGCQPIPIAAGIDRPRWIHPPFRRIITHSHSDTASRTTRCIVARVSDPLAE